MNIHVWVPDFTGATGGLQTFSRFLVRGLRDCCPGAELRVFAKNDTSVPDVEERSLARFESVGTWPEWERTGAFTSKLLWSGYRDRPDLIIVAHVNFAPVAKALRNPFSCYWTRSGNLERSGPPHIHGASPCDPTSCCKQFHMRAHGGRARDF